MIRGALTSVIGSPGEKYNIISRSAIGMARILEIGNVISAGRITEVPAPSCDAS